MKPLYVAVLFASMSFAQSPKPEPAPQQLTELERTQLENLALRSALLNTETKQLQQKQQEFEEQVRKNHPGYVLNAQTGELMALPKSQPVQEPKK